MPKDNVIMGLIDTWVAAVVIDVHVVHANRRAGEILKLSMGIKVLDRYHIDSAYQPALAVIGAKGADRKCLRLNIKCAQTRIEVRETHEFAYLSIVTSRRRFRHPDASA